MPRSASSILLLLAAGPALAADPSTGFDAHNFHLFAADGQPVGSLQNATPFLVKGVFGGVVFEYADSPLLLAPLAADGSPDVDNAVAALDNVAALNLDVGWAPVRFFRFDLGLPLFLASAGAAGDPNGFTAGDLRIAATAGWSKRENRGFGVGLTPWVTVPLGGDAAFLGQSGVAAGAELSAGYRGKRLLAAANVGYDYAPDIALLNLGGADLLRLGATVGYEVVDHLGVTAEIRTGRALGASTPGLESPTELLAHAKYQLPLGVYALAGGGAGLGHGVGTASYRVFAGVGFGPVFNQGPPPPAPILDRDGDGLNDDVDACPDEPETVNGYKDEDGCPDQVGSLRAVSTVDGKQVPGAVTVTGPAGSTEGVQMVTIERAEPGTTWSGKATWSCYAGEANVTAIEGDTAMDIALKPVLDAKARVTVVDKKGRPVKTATVRWDSSGAGGCVPGATDPVPNGSVEQAVGAGRHRVFVTAPDMTLYSGDYAFESGQTVEIKVVLDNTKIKLEATQIKILDKVYFETDKDIIKSESFGLLDEVASVILAHPEIGRVEVAGHTDSDGEDAHNLDLSQRRAASVQRYLEGKGVDAARLLAHGYGETQPIASNKSKSGKATNRRVEFKLVDQAVPAAETPKP